MDANTVLQNNELIAIFMGVKITSRNGEPAVFMFKDAVFPEYFRCTHYNKYHSDWNILMSVVEKIETLSTEKDGKFGVYIYSNHCVIQGTNFRPTRKNVAYFSENFGGNKIIATYVTVVQFIIWYNAL